MPNLTENAAGVSYLAFKAGGTIVKNRLVKLDSTAGQVIACTAIADVPFGVAKESASLGDMVAVQIAGVAQITASAAVALGAQVMATASGAGKCSTAAGATAYSVGKALAACSNDGEEIPVQLMLAAAGPANS